MMAVNTELFVCKTGVQTVVCEDYHLSVDELCEQRDLAIVIGVHRLNFAKWQTYVKDSLYQDVKVDGREIVREKRDS